MSKHNETSEIYFCNSETKCVALSHTANAPGRLEGCLHAVLRAVFRPVLKAVVRVV
jgi:hypothetical protein